MVLDLASSRYPLMSSVLRRNLAQRYCIKQGLIASIRSNFWSFYSLLKTTCPFQLLQDKLSEKFDVDVNFSAAPAPPQLAVLE
jgi:hypothetical protein